MILTGKVMLLVTIILFPFLAHAQFDRDSTIWVWSRPLESTKWSKYIKGEAYNGTTIRKKSTKSYSLRRVSNKDLAKII